jgi:hypothetical protein
LTALGERCRSLAVVVQARPELHCFGREVHLKKRPLQVKRPLRINWKEIMMLLFLSLWQLLPQRCYLALENNEKIP